MKTMFYGTLKKIEKAGGKLGGGAATTATPSATPAFTTPKKARASKKRKASPVDEDEDDEEATPATKKQSRKTEAFEAASKGTLSLLSLGCLAQVCASHLSMAEKSLASCVPIGTGMPISRRPAYLRSSLGGTYNQFQPTSCSQKHERTPDECADLCESTVYTSECLLTIL